MTIIPCRGRLQVAAAQPAQQALVIVTVTPFRADRFTASIDDRIICKSRTPLLSAARVLLARGHSADAILVMRWSEQDHDALRAPLGLAAQLTVNDSKAPRFAKLRPTAGAGAVFKCGQHPPCLNASCPTRRAKKRARHGARYRLQAKVRGVHPHRRAQP